MIQDKYTSDGEGKGGGEGRGGEGKKCRKG